VAASESEAAARRARRAITLSEVTERQVTIDPETQELVHQSIDARSGEVVVQYPDRSLLGMRAYIDRLGEKQKATRPGPGTRET
jgi:hypothetical protein